MKTEAMKIYAAPLQGVTDCVWRHFHAKHYPGSVERYMTPFVRLEQGEPRPRDVRDTCSPLNEGVPTEAQIIFSGPDEFATLTEALVREGHRRINLNMGCPFPLQVKRGRGAGILGRPEVIAAVGREMERWVSEVDFSAKMRVGVEDSSGWERLMAAVNALPLQLLTIHPRTARQQYGGEPDWALFGLMAERSVHPVVYNGDLLTPDHFRSVAGMFPAIAGVMIGRGLCARPSLAAEIAEGREWPHAERIARLLCMHDDMRAYYEGTLCGEAQIASKLKALWEYSEHEIGRKAWKAIHKATSIKAYDRDIALIDKE